MIDLTIRKRFGRMFLFLTLQCAIAVPGFAETRRALVIGIDQYVPAQETGTDSRWKDLRGAENDATAMRSLLVSRYGFDRDNVRVLLNAEATRDAILAGLSNLSAASSPGDLGVFFYAGHGSQIRSASGSERDLLDETIVPADSNRGASDIRDKTLRAAFNDVLDRGSKMVAIFDSCNSGSITRSLRAVSRSLPPSQDASIPTSTPTHNDGRPSPEQRGAIILSAAVDGRAAHETQDDEGRPRGLFSLSLMRALRQAHTNESVDRIFRRIRATMQAANVTQHPVLAGREVDRRLPLFGGTSTPEPRSITVAVVSIGASRLVLDAGIAAGLNPGAELLAETDTAVPMRLRVVEAIGMAQSSAEVLAGDSRRVKLGDLFKLDRWAAPGGADLRVSIPNAASREQIDHMVGVLAALREAGQVEVLEDLTASKPTHRIFWNASSWWLEKSPAPQALGTTVSAEALRVALGASTGDEIRLWVSLPPVASLSKLLESYVAESRGSITLVDAEHADYVLVGSPRAHRLAYSWVRPGGRDGIGLPQRSSWVDLKAADQGVAETAEGLASVLAPLAKIRAWLMIETPPDDGSFPYHLTLLGVETGRRVTGGVVFGGDVYQLTMESNALPTSSEPVRRRYVYVFAIDSFGRRLLLYPRLESGSGDNLLPPKWPSHGKPANSLRLGEPFVIAPPYGTDSFVMLTTEQPLADPRILEGAPIRTRRPGLDAILSAVGSYGGGKPVNTPSAWSVRRLVIRTVER